MKSTLITKVFVVLFLAFFYLDAAAVAQSISASAVLSISVFNDVDAPSTLLTQAEGRASLILHQAGVSVRWLNCEAIPAAQAWAERSPSPCSSIVYPDHLSIRLIAKAPALPSDVFGQSFLNAAGQGAYSNVYYGRVYAAPAGQFLGTGNLLGFVMAHEIGHLLLGSDSHSASGIMCSRWDGHQLRLAANGGVFFTAREGESLRARLNGPTFRAARRAGPR
jgi:hypothetical protein